jgi:hypothetical protein
MRDRSDGKFSLSLMPGAIVYREEATTPNRNEDEEAMHFAPFLDLR